MGRLSSGYVGTDGPRFPVLVGADGDVVTTELDAGRSVPPPVLWPAVFDTGTNITVINREIVRRLSLIPLRQQQSTTGGGVVWVELYKVSLGFPPVFGLTTTTVLEERLEVAVLPDLPDDHEVLFGMDLLNRCRLFIDGPNLTFTLDF
jgi:gag-polyprotein putative aspartyl protease